ncbi:NarL family two-component system response regulator YdfI [Clostridium acetobutylicum]|uniref:Stage 0 sporulation protein A homolog n=1 Tax=Clostridium acetobutylicum (strain ATCC 824 / DSM 792 / JCM 1419 / IAM 19013 / LMG 5710 / NBRC 13948 / NRRL B-527 / VKM B-1787 / 2291 / W) TaxID=272562 RepID=Q97DP3_CLOAB|nr:MULTISPECIES: response regulator transcription factor [Clostridium]AAK81359.1 Response regulator (CheY-like receiver domain and HTH-type DNA-binding domain) [Clostridium acetobutylicum ATCC 824]AEI33114.1 response regulator [Clostridium acetobutylicum DSM 1731]AWV80973.1 DNA-binding response regulator [Clostridium acetobutylicum]MBC2393703.1 response regulator transcription factor [Clostridium acetobutylicum]MBC2584300.1 response regulator transcription factor [Clostridium acetobutylicum]
MSKRRILVVDDHFVVREGLKLIFELEDEYEVVGEAENGEQALLLIDELKPDVILMDLSMPKMSGLDVLKALKEKENSIPIIILTTYNEDNLIKEGLSLGAKGYLLKDTTREELIRTVESAFRGELLLQPEVSKVLFNVKKKESTINTSFNASITERELFILQSIARGCKSKEIAFDMGISERTVKAHLTNIYSKLQVSSRSEAVAKAIEKGIIHVQK